MNHQVIKKWIKALESGNYSFTRGKLKRLRETSSEYSYCAIGVLREISPEWTDLPASFWNTKTDELTGIGTDRARRITEINDQANNHEAVANYLKSLLEGDESPESRSNQKMD